MPDAEETSISPEALDMEVLSQLEAEASRLHDDGDFTGAVGLLRKALEIHRKFHGDVHSESLEGRNRLARSLRAADYFDEAADLYWEVLGAQLARLGPDDPRTLRTRSRLANTCYAAGRYGEAATQFEDILRERFRVLGPMHPDTLRSRGSLANTYACLGRYDDAEALHRQTVQDREEVLGPVHPRTELSRVRLGAVLKVSQNDVPASDPPPSEKENPK